MSISRQIETLMKASGVSRYKLSKDTGIPYTTLTQIINGRTKDPQVGALEAIADYFHKPLDYLLGKSFEAIVQQRLEELGLTIEQLSEQTAIPLSDLQRLDAITPGSADDGPGGIVSQLAAALRLDPEELASALARQEAGAYGNAAAAAGRFRSDEGAAEISREPETIAAHHDGEDWTEEELEEIRRFKEFIRSKRQQR
jgi:transcriptional regulator with XRE-family HTH domain